MGGAEVIWGGRQRLIWRCPRAALDDAAEFADATAGVAPALVLLLRGGRGGGSRGSGGIKKVSPLIAQLGSGVFFVNAMCVLAHIKSHPKSMAHPPCKYLRRLNQVWGTRWCPQN